MTVKKTETPIMIRRITGKERKRSCDDDSDKDNDIA